MKKKELAKNTLILFIGKFCTQFISFFLLPLYTAKITTAEYGVIDLLTTYISLLAPILTLQLENAVFRFLIDARGNENNSKIIITNSILATIISVLIFIVLYLILLIFVKIEYTFLFPLCLIVTILSSIILQISRGLGDNLTYAIASVIAGAGTVILNVVFLVIMEYGASSIFLSTIIANALCVIYIFIAKKLHKYISKKIDFKQLKEMLKYSIPLIPNGIIWWIIGVSDRTIITIFCGASLNGIYAISKKFSNLVMNLYGIFNMSWTESISLHIKEDNSGKYISEILHNILNISLFSCAIIILGVGLFFPILIDSSYNEAYNYIPLLFIGTIFNILSSFFGSIYIATKKTKEVAKTSILAGIVNLIIGITLIKFLGLYAACISTIVSFLVITVYRYIDLKKYTKIDFKIKKIILPIIIFGISIIIYHINSNLISLITLAIFIIAFGFRYGKNFYKKVQVILKRR